MDWIKSESFLTVIHMSIICRKRKPPIQGYIMGIMNWVLGSRRYVHIAIPVKLITENIRKVMHVGTALKSSLNL